MLVVLFREDRLDSRTVRIPLWALRAAVGVAVTLAVLALAGIAFYGPVARAAARVPGLTREIERLEVENAQVADLARVLDSVEAGYLRLRTMVGADVVPDPVALSRAYSTAPAIVARYGPTPRFASGTGIPSYWPLDETGFVTRGTSDTTNGAVEPHPGLDIAVREGSLVRATATGMVLEATELPDYGLYVRLGHAEGYESAYGHLSRVLVTSGSRVLAGEVIGLSGNTGRSTAPHLHFEIRREGRWVDPSTMLREGS